MFQIVWESARMVEFAKMVNVYAEMDSAENSASKKVSINLVA